MRSPADMKVIQIDITNACTKRCGNCTRFCGHHTKPFFMDFDTFRQAVDSLKDFEGIVGVMGGEPTIHPQFAEFAAYLRDILGYDDLDKAAYAPQPAFLDHILRNAFNFERGQNNRRGLWTSISNKYAEHFELIQDTFGVQCVNDHSSPSLHTTLMSTRKELGIPDEQWFPMRDNCWVQNNWSASITPKGAFFCEVAAAMDATLNGPGGWKIEPGWWRRRPQDFVDQLHWCEMCSACLPVPKCDANQETDNASPVWMEKLKGIASPKLRKGLVAEFDPRTYVPDEYHVTQGQQPYLDSNQKRIGVGQQILVPKKIVAILDVDDLLPVDDLRRLIEANRAALGVAALLSDSPEHHALAGELGVPVITCQGRSGRDLFDLIKARVDHGAWVLLLHGSAATEDLVVMLGTHVFNPGCFYSLGNQSGRPSFQVDFFNFRASALRDGGDLFALTAFYAPRKIQAALAPSCQPMPAPAVHSAPRPRVAVVTPYYKEEPRILAECCESVRRQTYPATHFMVADGFPSPDVGTWPVEHLVLPRAHANNGNTPRSIGSLSAVAQGYDAIAYLDADNWYSPEHIEGMVDLARSTQAAICTCGRTMHRPDGSLMYWDLESGRGDFVDTSCLFLTRRAFRLAALWNYMPNEMAPICDRVFWVAVKGSQLPRAHRKTATVAFRSHYAAHFEFIGEEPPPGAVTDEQFHRAWQWWWGQTEEFRQLWVQYFVTGAW